MTQSDDLIQAMAADLLALGVRPGGVLLVHASLRSLGLPAGGQLRAEIAVLALQRALGPQGTLLMPALSYQFVCADNPVFDVLTTPSCVGALPEYFRTRPGTQRSVHPTHSVSASGPRAGELLRDHMLDHTPVGPNSPFARLPGAGGQLLFLGCGLLPNTSMHGIEEHVVPEYLFGDELDYHILLPGGQPTSMRVRRHNFSGWRQRYDRVAGIMDQGITEGRVLDASCYLLDAATLWQAALPKLRAEPLFFVDRSE